MTTTGQERYEELVAKEEELRLLKKALSTINTYSNSTELELIKKIFNTGGQEQ